MSRKKTELEQELAKAKASGRYMVAVWSESGNMVNLYRMMESFPIKDVSVALNLLEKDLDKITLQDKTPAK